LLYFGQEEKIFSEKPAGKVLEVVQQQATRSKR
jgi:hypothetical protein